MNSADGQTQSEIMCSKVVVTWLVTQLGGRGKWTSLVLFDFRNFTFIKPL